MKKRNVKLGFFYVLDRHCNEYRSVYTSFPRNLELEEKETIYHAYMAASPPFHNSDFLKYAVILDDRLLKVITFFFNQNKKLELEGIDYINMQDDEC